MLPHHPGSTQAPFPQQAFGASNVSAATFPDGGGAIVPPNHHLPPKSNAGGPASGALSDLLGLESELTNIQVILFVCSNKKAMSTLNVFQAGIRQIDKIAPSAPMSFQTDSMIPIGSLQPSSNNFPNEGQMNQQPYPGLPHAPTAMQAKELAPSQQETQLPLNPALMTQAQPQQQQQQQLSGRPDPFGGTPFLPPPPSSKTNRAGGSQGRYQFPPSNAEQQMASGGYGGGEDRYAVFEALSGGQQSQGQSF